VKAKRPAVRIVVVCVVLLALGIIAVSCGSSDVRWYVTDGLEVVDGKVQFRLAEVTEAHSGVSAEKLTQLALDFDPSFFTGVASGERITLGSPVSGERFTLYLYTNGYEELAKTLVAFEVRGELPQPAGN
jgi:hypothetical protein